MPIFFEEEISTYNPDNKDESVLNYLKHNKEKLTPFRFDYGTDDPLIDYNRELYSQPIALEVHHD